MEKIEPRLEDHNNYDHLQAAADDPNKVHIVLQSDRLGTRLFCVKLEYEHYRPRSGRNKLYDFHMVQWPFEEGKPLLMWFVVGIPLEEFHLAEQVAAEVGLNIRQGTIIMFAGGKEEHFPMTGDRVYGVSSNSKSPTYSKPGEIGDPEKMEERVSLIEDRKRGELAECERIIKEDEDLMRVEFRQKGFGEDQIDRILAAWNAGNGAYMEEPNAPVDDGQHRFRSEF